MKNAQRSRAEAKGFYRRLDLCESGVHDYYWAKDFGSLICRKVGGWWATNDIRRYEVGTKPNEEFAQPTLGPFKSLDEALTAYLVAKAAR